MSDPIIKGLTSSRKRDGRFGEAWAMGRATFAYSMAHECGFWSSLKSGAELFFDYLTRPTGGDT